MIHRNSQTLQIPSWQIELSQAIKDPKALFELLELPKEYLPKALQAHQIFPLRAPMPFIKRIQKRNINDPLLKQILPLDFELESPQGYSIDPVGDHAAEKLPGLIHKYQGRVLLTLTGVCGIHCRYCFRRHFDYQASNPTKKHWSDILEYVKADASITEVILSGGDPLSISDSRLKALISDIENIAHVKFLRIHTRQPVIIPSRVTDELINLLSQDRLKTIMVLHINHAQEIDDYLKNAVQKLKQANIDLLNQAVLLKNINDDAQTLIDLSLQLGEIGIFPYYLHLLDKVVGASHFDTAEDRAVQLVEIIKKSLPGYLTPRLVREVAGGLYKQDITG